MAILQDELFLRRRFLFRLWAEDYQREILGEQKQKELNVLKSSSLKELEFADTFVFRGLS